MPTDHDASEKPGFSIPWVEAADLEDIPFVQAPATEDISRGETVDSHACEAEDVAGQPVFPVPKPPHPGFWWSVVWWLSFIAIMICSEVIGIVIAILMQAARAPDPQAFLRNLARREVIVRLLNDGSTWIPVIVTNQLAVLTYALLIVRFVVGKDWKRRLALRRPSVSHLVLVLVGLLPMICLSSGIYTQVEKVLPHGLDNQRQLMKIVRQWPMWFGVLVIGLGPGLTEELWFRGFLGRGLVGHYGVVAGVLLCSVFFGLNHLDPPKVLATLVMGIWLHFCYLMSRSLWVSIFVHFLNNSLAVLSLNFPFLEWLDPKPEHHPFLNLAGALLLIIAVGWALYQSRVRLEQTQEPGKLPWHPAFAGVEIPPAGRSTKVIRPWPGWLASALVAVAAVNFAVIFFVWR